MTKLSYDVFDTSRIVRCAMYPLISVNQIESELPVMIKKKLAPARNPNVPEIGPVADIY